MSRREGDAFGLAERAELAKSASKPGERDVVMRTTCSITFESVIIWTDRPGEWRMKCRRAYRAARTSSSLICAPSCLASKKLAASTKPFQAGPHPLMLASVKTLRRQWARALGQYAR